MDVSRHIVEKTGLVPMQFREAKRGEQVRRYRNINPGEIAGVPPEDVEALIQSGWASLYRAPEKNNQQSERR